MTDGAAISRPPRAVVFGYHSVGVTAIKILLQFGVDIPLIVTHQDDPDENTWFDSVGDIANWADIRSITPNNPNTPEIVKQVRACAPEWIFSFYYRHLLGPELLAIPSRGALNLHGSLLPKYRGRAPLNWVLVHGESQTGMSLHRMVAKPDAGALIDQEPAPILPNDTAVVLMQRLLCASERLLLRALPDLFAGRALDTPLDLNAGSYFSGRRPEDGRIDPNQPAWKIHNLIRAVAPPYPGAFLEYREHIVDVLGSWYQAAAAHRRKPRLYWEDAACWLDCSNGERLRITRIEVGGEPFTARHCQMLFGVDSLDLRNLA